VGVADELPATQEATVICLHWAEAEAQEWKVAFHATEDRRHRDRLQIVQLAHRGRKRPDIATDLGVHRKTVTR
jgi:hypothetical protein